MIKIYTDGACSGNPGPAGIGIVIINGTQVSEFSEYIGKATNNIAELQAIYTALYLIKDKKTNITIYTDSQYSINLFTKNYVAKKNKELVSAIAKKIKSFKSVEFKKVKAHSDNYYNNIADKLATQSILNKGGLKECH